MHLETFHRSIVLLENVRKTVVITGKQYKKPQISSKVTFEKSDINGNNVKEIIAFASSLERHDFIAVSSMKVGEKAIFEFDPVIKTVYNLISCQEDWVKINLKKGVYYEKVIKEGTGLGFPSLFGKLFVLIAFENSVCCEIETLSKLQELADNGTTVMIDPIDLQWPSAIVKAIQKMKRGEEKLILIPQIDYLAISEINLEVRNWINVEMKLTLIDFDEQNSIINHFDQKFAFVEYEKYKQVASQHFKDGRIRQSKRINKFIFNEINNFGKLEKEDLSLFSEIAKACLSNWVLCEYKSGKWLKAVKLCETVS